MRFVAHCYPIKKCQTFCDRENERERRSRGKERGRGSEGVVGGGGNEGAMDLKSDL